MDDITRILELDADNHRRVNDKFTAEIQERARAEIDLLRSDLTALQRALVGDTGLSAIEEAHRLRALHPLTSVKGAEN